MYIDPTYLRYIVDGLANKFIQQEHIASLPQGLMGMYEESIPAEQNIRQREKFLQFFSVWALLKKEVSTSFVADLLNWKEQEVIDYISVYSKWFNNPASGTYILYHERLRAYLLSKITSDQLNQTNQKIIRFCQHALESRKGDEWETYALEHLPAHLLAPAMQDEVQGVIFRNLVYNTAYWNRQLENSKGYDWSKKMLNLALVWAAKQNTDELIECALNKIDLHYMEQNDAPRIIELVAQNDIETALQRIESFGGNDKDGLYRKFTLYMLCLMELTLLGSKEKPFSKTSIEKLLNHLDENIPIDHSLLKWNDFFSSYLMFQMACEWAKLGLDYLRIYKRTDIVDIDWAEKKYSFSDIQIETLVNIVYSISDINFKSNLLLDLSKIIRRYHLDVKAACLLEDSLKLAYIINDNYSRSNLLFEISKEFKNQGKFETSIILINESLLVANKISNRRSKDIVIKNICIELLRQKSIKKSLDLVNKISSTLEKVRTNMILSTELLKFGMMKESDEIKSRLLDEVKEVKYQYDKCCVLRVISIEIANQGKLQESLKIALNITDNWEKNYALENISNIVLRNGMIAEALNINETITDNYCKANSLIVICTELAEQNDFEKSKIVLRQIFDLYKNITLETSKESISRKLALLMIKMKKYNEALKIVFENVKGNYQNTVLNDLAYELINNCELEEALNLYFSLPPSFIDCKSIANTDDFKRIYLLIERSLKRSKENKIWNFTSLTLSEIAKLYFINGDETKSFQVISNISNIDLRCDTLLNISKISLGRGKKVESKKIIENLLLIISNSSDQHQTSKILKIIVKEFYDEHYLDLALKIAFEITIDYKKPILLSYIATVYIYLGRIIDGQNLMQKAFNFANEISYEINRNHALSLLSIEYMLQGNLKMSEKCISNITYDSDKIRAFCKISSDLLLKNNKIESFEFTKKAINCLSQITSDSWKDTSIGIVASHLIKNGGVDEAFNLIEGIKDVIKYDTALCDIALELLRQERNSIALESIARIHNINIQWDIKSKMSIEFSKNKNIGLALEIVSEIKDEILKNETLQAIAINVIKEKDHTEFSKIIFEIKKITNQQEFWKKIAFECIETYGLFIAFYKLTEFNLFESRIYYLKGWAESIKVDDISDELAYKAIQALKDDSTSMEHFLQVYAQHELFFGSPSQEKIDRLNKTLNLQWAMDIIEQFPQE